MSGLPSPPPPPGARRGGFPAGRLLLGLLIVAVGIGWLLQAFDVVEIPWDVILPSALILVGLTLVVAARSGGGQGGLIALGIVLTLVLLAATVVDVPFRGGVGQRVVQPRSISALHREYDLAIGEMTIDLSEISAYAPVPREVRARVGIGHLAVLVPRGLLVEVEGHAGIGQVAIFGRQRSGVDVRDSYAPFGPTQGFAYALDLSVGIGQVEVRHG